ncbi:F-box/LRR-repeat/kelch-repeat protein [Cardamine amara subsp. amara]|uniref:F-box/LRR-repeat/kelch-repeat protein n=1 Tax=Cardamine amara subsp. amara TaxID=228776 RepID=A0ABD1C675_CARAN
MAKKQRCLRMESLPQDVVEHILERLAVNSLLRFKSVSKQWKSIVESTSFQKRQFKLREQSGDPDVLMVSAGPNDDINPFFDALRTLELGSSSAVKIPTDWDWEKTPYLVSHGSFDGLVCLYYHKISGFVVNPTTRWYRPLPLCHLQQLILSLGDSYYQLKHSHSKLGFGKDKFTGTYKLVWLYNSSEISLENATTCEVFDFSTNAWRYVTPAAPYRVVGGPDPVYVDGSLHWFTECKETKILSFDLHTEAFQVISKAPFANVHADMMVMCNLDNRLCVSEMKRPNQVIWSFNSANQTWHQMFSIDLEATSHWLGNFPYAAALAPLTLLDGNKKKEKKKLLFCSRVLGGTLVVHDPETKSYHLAFDADSIGYPVCYFQSLISIS